MMSEIKTLDETKGEFDISEEKVREPGGITVETIDEMERNELRGNFTQLGSHVRLKQRRSTESTIHNYAEHTAPLKPQVASK